MKKNRDRHYSIFLDFLLYQMQMKNIIQITVMSLVSLITLAVVLVSYPSPAYAWESPQLTANCAPDESHYSFSIVLQPGMPNYVVDFNWDDVWNNNHNAAPAFTTDFGSAGSHDFVTGREGSVLWARFQDDTGAVTSQSANNDLCATPTPTPTFTPVPTSVSTPTETPQTSNQGGPGDGRSDGLGCGSNDCSNQVSAQGAVLSVSTEPQVLGLSTTSGNGNHLLNFAQLLGALTMSIAGYRFFNKNA